MSVDQSLTHIQLVLAVLKAHTTLPFQPRKLNLHIHLSDSNTLTGELHCVLSREAIDIFSSEYEAEVRRQSLLRNAPESTKIPYFSVPSLREALHAFGIKLDSPQGNTTFYCLEKGKNRGIFTSPEEAKRFAPKSFQRVCETHQLPRELLRLTKEEAPEELSASEPSCYVIEAHGEIFMTDELSADAQVLLEADPSVKITPCATKKVAEDYMSLKDGIPDLKLFPNLSETVEAVNGSFCLTRIQPREEVHVDNINEVVKKELYRLDDRTLWCFANVSYQGERMAFTELIYTSTSYQAQSQSFSQYDEQNVELHSGVVATRIGLVGSLEHHKPVIWLFFNSPSVFELIKGNMRPNSSNEHVYRNQQILLQRLKEMAKMHRYCIMTYVEPEAMAQMQQAAELGELIRRDFTKRTESVYWKREATGLLS